MVSILAVLLITTSLKCGVMYAQSENFLPDVLEYQDNSEGSSNEIPLAEVNPVLDTELERMSEMLLSVLKHSWGPSGVPLVYVEDNSIPAIPDLTGKESPEMEKLQELSGRGGFTGPTLKRSRYYRRYPWKRQNSRSRTRYEVDNRYMCQPTREDVFKLLVALHETRAGNGGKSINFCNRRRSAGAIFTNIRFLGRK